MTPSPSPTRVWPDSMVRELERDRISTEGLATFISPWETAMEAVRERDSHLRLGHPVSERAPAPTAAW